ncbi:hypothetical protein MN116_001690 [Schistosoma mekongi]|uniref:Oxidative stress-responsive serine-rich protein 1 n=1 Tax=Schistosoma mekongi TaxID=38744 RepID=A0AAE1ZHV4_SCHME|nr:hypothetical protein MN116_001690 [Schistosoma mekongi]
MKVKKSKASDLVDSLKHLKISDRRFRPQLKAFTLHALASLNEVSSKCRCNFRMTRSALSAAVVSYGFRCCKACEYCRVLRKVGMEGEVIDNNSDQVRNLYPCLSLEHSHANCTENAQSLLEPPILSTGKSSGCPCTTLPSRRCHSNFRAAGCDLYPLQVSCFEPSHLHRSYGNELSEIEQDPNSVTQSPYNTTNTLHSDHPLCCCHVIGFHLPHHLRLYRRLYGLIDHPCVSLHYPCKHRAHTRTTLPSGCSTGAATSFRRSLSSRHRHAINPASVYRFSIDSRTASCSKSLDTECDSGLTDISPGSNYCSIHQHTAMLPCLQQSVAKYRSQPTENRLVGTQRCRRNSDPESWQQFRNLQDSGPLSSNVNENSDLDASDDNRFCQTEEVSCNSHNEQTDIVSVRRETFTNREIKVLGCNFQYNATNHQSVNKLPHPIVDSNVNENNLRYGYVLSNTQYDQSFTTKTTTNFPASNISNSAFTSANENSNFRQMKFSQSSDILSHPENSTVLHSSSNSQQQQFHFRPSLLSSTEHGEPESSIMYTSDTCFSLHYNKLNNVSSSVIIRGPHTETQNRSGIMCDPLLWSNSASVDSSLKQQPFVESDLKMKTNIVHCSNDVDYLPGSDVNNHVNNNKPQLVSDVSVNELASYMEHMVHIPGKMSEMAQRMYL